MKLNRKQQQIALRILATIGNARDDRNSGKISQEEEDRIIGEVLAEWQDLLEWM